MNLFIRDGQSAIDYECFGDVMTVDTTFRTNRYNLIRAPFVGINHQDNNIMFAIAFLSDETTETFQWLFDAFLESMERRGENKLGAENLEYLHRSCLGHLFEIANITLQAPLLVVMLKNLGGTSLKRRTLSFRFNSRSIEFNKEDYSLMTGLKYDMLTDLTHQQSEIHSTVFSSKRTIKFEDINTAFFNECAKNGGSSQLPLKLGLLYIVYGFFLICDKAVDDIDLKYLHLLDDVEPFIQYPWGQVAYNFLHYSSGFTKSSQT